MLVLSRKTGEEIVIDDTVFISVLEIRGNRVRIGLSAPDHVKIHRGEVSEILQQSAKVTEVEVTVADPQPQPC